MAGVEEEVDLPAVPPRELVERPGGDRGLPQLRERLGALAVAGVAERLLQPRALGDELLQVGGIELVDRLLDVHGGTLLLAFQRERLLVWKQPR